MEAVDGQAIDGEPARLFLSGGRGRLCRGDGVPCLPALLELLIVKQQRRQGLTHMPFDVIRQYAEDKMGAAPLFLVMVNRPYQDIDTLQGAKSRSTRARFLYPRTVSSADRRSAGSLVRMT